MVSPTEAQGFLGTWSPAPSPGFLDRLGAGRHPAQMGRREGAKLQTEVRLSAARVGMSAGSEFLEEGTAQAMTWRQMGHPHAVRASLVVGG